MSSQVSAPQPSHDSTIRRLIARHPITAYLVMLFAVTIAFELPLIRARLGSSLFGLPLTLDDSLGTILGVALPAFLVVGAMGGQVGVLDLARRSLRWRVGARWYLFATLAIPMATLLGASAIYGFAPLNALSNNWFLLFTVVLPEFLVRVIFLNLPEEIGFTGFLLDRLQDRHGPFKACLLVEIPFALFHLPGFIVDVGLNDGIPIFLVLFGLLVIGQLASRFVILWLYNNTRRSVLLVGLFHSSFNVTVGALGREYIPGFLEGSVLLIGTGVVVLMALIVIGLTRGRLAYKGLPSSAYALP